jgi:predicted nucleic acid-binding protein
MIFGNLQSGEQVFLDANTLAYHFGPDPVFGPACSQLVQRIEQQDLSAFTSTHVLTELAHQLMMVEAATLPGWKPTKVKRRLRQQPAALQSLTRFRKAIETVLNSQIRVLTIDPALILTATGISQTASLLSSDALIVAVMQHHGLVRLASNDTDFDRVPGLMRYAPV